jgi:type II secretory pathway predicted ATPase ExeA
MLTTYWNLKGMPFTKSIKTDQLFQSNHFKELASRLEYMKQHRGIMLISGQPGCGKTTAMRTFIASLSQLSFHTFYVPLATVNILDFYRQLNYKLGGESAQSKSALFYQIQQRINDMFTNDKKTPVIIFDEAHLLKNENFTELQIITNFNMDSTDPALIILVGQPHLADRLMRPVLRSFYQRIALKYHLIPLPKDDVAPFIEHHLKLSGCQSSPFSQQAIDAIFKNTAGVPRLIEKLALKTMTLGMIQKVQTLTEEHVFQASKEL